MIGSKQKEPRQLPTLPAILLRIIEVCNQEDVQFQQLSGIIEKDPALTTKILKMINSPVYGLPNKVVSLAKALVLIGIDAVKNIALCASIHQVFAEVHDGEHFHFKAFWQHSLMCAVLSRALAERFKYPNTDEAFLAGLLHDVGKLIIWTDNPQEYDKLIGQFQDKPEKLLTEELKLGGLHSEIGSRLIAEWNLPSLMADAVLYHHEPLFRIVDAFILVKIVHVANQICHNNETAAAETVFGLSPEVIKAITDQARKDTQEAARSLDIEIEEEKTASAEKKQQLAREIRDISMLLGTMASILRAADRESLFPILYQALKILFGYEKALFFEYDVERDLLISRSNGSGTTDLQELLIPYEESGAIVARSLREGKALNSWEHKDTTNSSGDNGNLMDEQLARMLGKDGLICVPLINGKTRLGVLAVGMDQAEQAALKKQEKRLTLLTAQFAASLYTYKLRSIQTKVIHFERVVASTDLAHRIVHEARNPLGIIRNYMKILGRKLTEEHGVTEELKILEEELGRVGRLLDELAEFSEPPQQEKRLVDINQLIADVTAMIRDSLLTSSPIALHLDLDNALTPFTTEEDSLKQIVLNLLKNAIEAVAERGSITITSRKLPSAPSEIPLTSPAASYAEITVSDDGPGIPETLRLSLFDPYSSTKKDHQGLGLSIVYNLVRHIGGLIRVRSRKKGGTLFSILLPIE